MDKPYEENGRFNRQSPSSSGRRFSVQSDETEDNGGSLVPDGDATGFPAKLHRMLSDIEENGLGMEETVSWQPHGRGRFLCVKA